MSALLERYREYFAKARARGASITSYSCPAQSCGKSIDTLQPPKGDVWQSLATCPYCDGQHFKVVRATGSVSVKTVEAAA